jgi:hypothetical protein
MEKWPLEGEPSKKTIRAMVSHLVLLSGNKSDNSNCKACIISFPNRNTIRGQAAQGLYEITLREEFAKMYKQEWRTEPSGQTA